MLGCWLSVAMVNISGYQPIAEQTWVQLNPAYYPPQRTPPAMFVAWRGNQFPTLELRKQKGRWQLLFPARLVPPFELFEGEAQLSKAYLARLRRIDELAYGLAPGKPLIQGEQGQRQQEAASLGLPFMAEFTLPLIPGQPRAASDGAEPLLVSLNLRETWLDPETLLAPVAQGEMEKAEPGVKAVFPDETPTLSAAVAEGGKRLCHRVVAGETLWRIATTLAQNGTVTGAPGDTHSYLLAIVADNRSLMGKRIRIKAGDALYCPAPQTLARFDDLSPAERRRRFIQLAQGR